MKKELYVLKPEHEKQIPEHNAKWIKKILNTDRLSEQDKELCVDAVGRMYDVAKLERPKTITFVSSPILLAFAGGLSRYIWNKRSSATRSATRSATDSATDSATHSATHSATYGATASATDSATRSATHSATRSATSSATHGATYGATYGATDSATHSATYGATASATRSATDSATLEITNGVVVPENYMKSVLEIANSLGYDKKDIDSIKEYIRGISSVWQGGCSWAQYDCFLSFFKDIAKLDIDYTAYQPYLDLTVAGYRILDRDFAMISEKPISIKMKNNLAHNLDGPAIEYMDGVKFYMAYGNLIPSYIVTTPVKDITKDMILKETNADYRRYLIERIGIEKYLEILGAGKAIDIYNSPVGGVYELLQVQINGEDTIYLKMKNQSEFVWHIEGVPTNIQTVKQALQFRNGMLNFKEPKFLS